MNQLNANSRQQFIIEEEGAYSQRSSDDDTGEQKRQARAQVISLQQVNSLNMNSQLMLQKKSSHPTTQQTKQNNFAYAHQGSAASNIVDPLIANKSNSRNGPRGESYNDSHGQNFNGDTGHDYNI